MLVYFHEFKYINLATSVSITLERSSCLHGHTGSSWPLTRRFVQSPSPRQISLRSQPSAFCFSPLICVSNRDVQGGFPLRPWHYFPQLESSHDQSTPQPRWGLPSKSMMSNPGVWLRPGCLHCHADSLTSIIPNMWTQTKLTFVFPTSQCESNTREE